MEISPPNEQIKNRTGIQVIARAAAILRTLRDHPDGLTLAGIAKALSLPRSTVQRIVEALDHENFVIAASPTRGVRLGPALLALAAHTRFEISEIARRTLQRIAEECRETAALSIFNGEKIIFIDQVPGGYELRVESPIGNSLPLHSTAPGKAILAALDANTLKKLRRRMDLDKLTQGSITDWNDLLQELDQIKKTGVAFDHEETSLGISAIGMALELPNGEYAAISIPVPTQRFSTFQQEKFKTILMQHVIALQKSLTGDRNL
ncbi:MAG: IclR family transcriptional regulator [Desulfopila sp.]